jgi:hypothetical protein
MAVLYLLAGGSVLNQNMLAQTKPETATTADTHAGTTNAAPSNSAERLEPVAAGQTVREEKRRVKSADNN